MWTVILHFSRGGVQTLKFEDKAEALKCIDIVVFKNEDCINLAIFKDTQSVPVKDPIMDALESSNGNWI